MMDLVALGELLTDFANVTPTTTVIPPLQSTSSSPSKDGTKTILFGKVGKSIFGKI